MSEKLVTYTLRTLKKFATLNNRSTDLLPTVQSRPVQSSPERNNVARLLTSLNRRKMKSHTTVCHAFISPPQRLARRNGEKTRKWQEKLSISPVSASLDEKSHCGGKSTRFVKRLSNTCKWEFSQSLKSRAPQPRS